MSDATGNEEVAGDAAEVAPGQQENLGSLGDAGHTFDQTNGLVDGLEGNTNGFAEDNDEGDEGGGTDGGDDSSVPLISPESQ